MTETTNPMPATQPWYRSRGVLGGLVAFAAGIATMFGLNLDAAWQGEFVNWLVALGGVIGGAAALWGRIKATKRIG
tara:strand:- start:260 stop:487 length:228 start_codon:yes stop_codon:yes gene_type:complete